MNRTQLVERWRRIVLAASLPFEANWTWRALRNTNSDIAQRLREQINFFDEMCITGTPKDIAEHGAATARGYGIAVELMLSRQAKAEKINLDKQGPNLQELIKQHGGFDKIPEEAWEWFERAKIVWKAKLVNGEFDRMFDDPSQQEGYP